MTKRAPLLFFAFSLVSCGNFAVGQEPSITAIEQAVVRAVEKAERSVVAIARVKRVPPQAELLDDDDLRFLMPGRLPRRFEADHPDFVPNDFGSGVVIDRAGLIVTNYHVLGDIEKSQYWVWVNRKPFAAQVKAADPWLDLAVLKIGADNLEPIALGDAKQLKKGRFVIALGNPHAVARDGRPSAAWGIVANLERKAASPKENTRGLPSRDTLHHFGTLIQADLRLPPGTSGGALINLSGEMVGLTTTQVAVEGEDTSGGFAIPVDDTFRRALDNLKQGKKVEYGFLGVAPELLPLEQRQRGATGIRIAQIVAGTPAANAGLVAGDVIHKVNGVEIFDDTELIRELSKLPVEADVELTIERTGPRLPGARPLTRTVRLSKKHLGGQRPEFSETADPSWRGLKIDYSTAIPNFGLRSGDVDPQGCVAITDVAKDSIAWKSGLRAGLFISHVEGKRVTTPKEFFGAVESLTGEANIRLTAAVGAAASRTIPAQ